MTSYRGSGYRAPIDLSPYINMRDNNGDWRRTPVCWARHLRAQQRAWHLAPRWRLAASQHNAYSPSLRLRLLRLAATYTILNLHNAWRAAGATPAARPSACLVVLPALARIATLRARTRHRQTIIFSGAHTYHRIWRTRMLLAT